MAVRNFQDTSKRILQPSFFMQQRKLEHRDVAIFWSQLSDSKNAFSYICDLIKLISQYEKDKKITSATKSFTLENLLSTLFAVSMFKDFDKKNELSSFKEKECANLQRANSQQMICPHTISMIETFFQVHSESSEPNFLSNLIGQICFFPDLTKQNLDTFNQESQIISHLQNYYKQLEKYNHMVQEESPSHFSMLLLQENQLQETGEFSYAYEYFWKYMKQKKRIVPRVVFDIIVRYFKVLPQIAKEYPDQAEKSILCLLHLTKQIITFFGVRENESIRTVLSQVQIFRRWPYPVGNMAQELVTLLFQEYKSNGNAFRYKVREEIPSVDIFTEQEIPKNNQQQGMMQSYPNNPGQKSRDHTVINIPPSGMIGQSGQNYTNNSNSQERLQYKAFVIADKDQSEISFLVQLSRLHENRIQNDHVLRAALVTNMLSLAKESHSDTDIPQLISKKKRKDVFTIYCQLLHIIDKNSELDDWDYIRTLQERQFGKIVQTIQEARNEDTISDESILSIITENTQTYIPEYPNCELEPIVPHVRPALSKQATSRINHPQNQTQEENPIVQSYYPLLNDQDIKELSIYSNQQQVQNDQNFRQRFSDKFFKKYFDMSLIKQNPQYQEPHRFVVMGGDAELQGLVQVLGEFFDTFDNKLMNQLDLRVFIVPTKKNTLAHYLASKDVWYQRYLYLPFREELVIPKFEKSDEGIEKDYQFNEQNDTKGSLLPQELKLMVLHTYIREANRAFNVRIYKINCTFQNQMKSVIYFCQYLEIGESVKAELIQRQKNLRRGENHLSLYEMKEKNQIKFGGVDLKITFQSVDYLGNKWEKETYEECFSSIKVNNVYKEYFEGNTPFPNSHWLEFTCITQENAKLFDSNLRNKHLFRMNARDPQSGADQVQSAFKALFTSIPVESLEVKIDPKENRSESTFQILVDGKIFSGLTEIKVEPVTLMSKERSANNEAKNNPHIFLSLPVMTFLPLKL